MDLDPLGPDAQKSLHEILGYLNFSSGAPDSGFLRNVNLLFQRFEAAGEKDEPAWARLASALRSGLRELRGRSEAFAQSEQAEAVLGLVFEHVLPGYRRFHRDLLYHQTDELLFRPFFLGRVCEAVLAQGQPWDEPDRIVPATIARLNDFIGHRPVAVLRTSQKIQPYAHEWVRPVPLYVEGAGVCCGRYREVLEKALELLRETPAVLLDQAWFDPGRMAELAVDPRAYDFDHPVNRRPNYHFGGWDPHSIDNRGHYCRYVLQQVTLDALAGRVRDRQDLPREQMVFEAAAVLAGTMLMGSGVTGSGPETHDSSVTLSTLLPHIAAYRDLFYVQLLERLSGPHGERLRAEARTLRQPFGGARQHLNQTLARRRAEQLQHVHLARLFARMGYTEAAARQAQIVPVASARLRCEIDCRATTAHLAIDGGDLDRAASLLPEMEDLLHRAIECGAMVDPWNILGFGGQFSKFPAVEDSIHDHRVDELIELMNDLFALYARLEEAAAAVGNDPLQERLSHNLEKLAQWWDRFASTEVGDVEGVSGRQAWESASQVAAALRAWRQAGSAAGKIAFWREHAEQFRSPKAYALSVEALLERHDRVAAMALLMHWLSQSQEIPLAEGPYSFHDLALRWMEDVWQPDDAERAPPARSDPSQRWPLAKKFIEYLEANAEDQWDVPRLELTGHSLDGGLPANGQTGDEEDDDEEDLFGAAYENVTYRDTTDDGFEGEMLEGAGGQATDFELAVEADRIIMRLVFLVTVARLWKLTATASAGSADPQQNEVLAGWLGQVCRWRRQFAELLAAVQHYRIPPPRGTHESLVEYDRRRAVKELLLERTISAAVETVDAGLLLRARIGCREPACEADAWEHPAGQVLGALIRGEPASLRAAWPDLLGALVREPLLYLPTARGGNPQRIAASRALQQVLRRLLVCLPRLGLLTEAHQLLGTIQDMERNHPVGPGAITEFDRLFEIGCKGIFQCLVVSSEQWRSGKSSRKSGAAADRLLIECLERAGEKLLRRWLGHSRHVRISVLEALSDRGRWQGVKLFIQRYGQDLFTQKFMIFANLRAILHQGVDDWLRSVEEDDEEHFHLLDDLDRGIPRHHAVQCLELILEAVVENYGEYVDYNSTTTQSDRGEMLYTLLDFLRLEASYDRVAWNVRPVVLAHEVLVRSGRNEAAEQWRRMVAERAAPWADEHLQRLEKLISKYGMRLPSICDRLGERFVRPLAVDRLCSLVLPSVDEVRRGAPPKSFETLQREIEPFTREPSGVGFDVPPWLEALENEVQRLRSSSLDEDDLNDPIPHLAQVRLSHEDAQGQIDDWEDE